MVSALSPQTLVYELKSADDPQISPDGSRIAYSLAQNDRESKQTSSQIWLCDVDGGAARRLTHSGDRNYSPRWSPDGSLLAFTSDRAPKTGLYVLAMQGGDARELVRDPGEINSPTWSPDGASLAYTAPHDPAGPPDVGPDSKAAPRVRVTDRIDYKQDGRGYLHDTRTQVFVVDLADGVARRLTSEPVDHEWPAWSPDGRWLAVHIPNRNGMHSQLGLVPAGGGVAKRIGPRDGTVSSWSWSADGRRIIFSGDTAATWQYDFFVYDLASDSVRQLTHDLQCLPGGSLTGPAQPAQPVWLDDRRVLFHAVRAGASGLYEVDSETGAVGQIQSTEALNAGASVDSARRFVVQTHASLKAVGEITVFNREQGKASIITRINEPVLGESPPARWEKLEVTREGFRIDAWLLMPPDFDGSRRYPVVLDVHGGPHSYYGYGFRPLQQCLATNGLLVVYANPRGSGSYGRDFTQQVIRDWGGQDYLDLMAVLDEVLKRRYADAQRVGVWGYSYGGYMTAWAISQSDRFKAAVCGAPCFDLESMYGTSDIGHSFGDLEWGGAPDKQRDWLASHSPSTFAHNTRTPTLIVHGEADERCPIGQGEQMFVALKKAGCETQFARYPGAAHPFPGGGRAEHREDLLARSLAWLESHLK